MTVRKHEIDRICGHANWMPLGRAPAGLSLLALDEENDTSAPRC